MLVKREDVKKPVLQEQVVPVPELNGDVLVRGLNLSARLGLISTIAKMKKDGNKQSHVPVVLEAAVLAGDEQPLFTAIEWEAWGAENHESTMLLWDIAWKLSDLGGEAATKNSNAPTSD